MREPALSQTKRVISSASATTVTRPSPSNRLIGGYADLVTSRLDDGWSGSILTFLFGQLPASRRSVLMRDEIERVYATFVTRVVRDPTRPSRLDRLPVLVGSLDMPVYKRGKDASTGDVRVNGGLHAHAILLVPPRSRLRGSVVDHFRGNDLLYRPLGRSRIARIHVEPIVADPERVVDYVLKSMKRAPYHAIHDRLILLPRALSELPSRRDRRAETPSFHPPAPEAVSQGRSS
jgi:hypothetical protein